MRLGVLALAACAAPSPAIPSAPRLAAIGETFTLDSKVLGERRTINVYVPPDYAKSTDHYPVLYMPDGGMAEDFPHVAGAVDVSIKNAVIRPVIVVGIENTERRRDLVGPTAILEEQKAAPHAGGTAKFRAFLRDELRPAIVQRYRTTRETALIGESLAGLFTLETLLVEPGLFDSYISVDPSVWWNDASLVAGANVALAGWTAGAKHVYIATADYQDTIDEVANLLTSIRIAGVPITVAYDPLPAEHHDTVYPTAALHGIRFVFGR